jgi:hypothetical protein
MDKDSDGTSNSAANRNSGVVVTYRTHASHSL